LEVIANESGWSAAEFAGVDLGDGRRNQRLMKLAEQLGAQPGAPLNQACGDWADVKAAYRLLGNEAVTPEAILAPHQARVRQRLVGQAVVLAVQDTTSLNYTAHPATTGLGPIATSQDTLRGLLLHTSLAVTTQGLPLGVLSQRVWARAAVQTQRAYRRLPPRAKESYKWQQALADSLALRPPGVQLVTVGDREADVYELLVQAGQLATHYVVRANQDRALVEGNQHLQAALRQAPVAGYREVAVAPKDQAPTRTARLAVRYARVRLRPPYRPRAVQPEPLPVVEVDAILAAEETPPPGVSPVEWLLLTNVAVTSLTQALERLDWYCLRWLIELYHKILKSGCRIETCRLGSAERLKRYLALTGVIAWRLLWLSYVNRQQPHSVCTSVLTEAEWQALYCTIHRTATPPAQPPTVAQAVRWIAQLGGFLARKGDKDPGLTTLWRGWQRLTDIAATWRLLRPPEVVGNS
jgi:hypothetical protein